MEGFVIKLCASRVKRMDLIFTDRFVIFYLLPQVKGEHGSLTVDALYTQFTVHKGKELGCDRHTQACSLYCSVADDIESFEGFEKLVHIAFLDAYSGIGNLKIQKRLSVFYFFTLHGKRHASFMRVLDRIGKKIENDLVYTCIITVVFGRKIRIDAYLELELLFLSSFLNRIDKICDERAETVAHRNDLHLAVFYLGEIKYAVYKLKKVLSGIPDIAGVFPDTVFPEYHLVHSEYRIDRRSDLMGHVGKEITLGFIRFIRGSFLESEHIGLILLLLSCGFHLLDFFAVCLLILVSDEIEYCYEYEYCK